VKIALVSYGTIFMLVIITSVISLGQSLTYGESTIQLCVNGQCKIVSDNEGFHSQNTCINDECNTDSNRNNSTADGS